MAIESADKGADDKLSTGFARLTEEDLALFFREILKPPDIDRRPGRSQINTALGKLKDKYGVSVNIVLQKIAYRETIKGTSDVQGKHKKQSGGSGQYGDVHIKFSPSQQEFDLRKNSSAVLFRNSMFRQ